MAGQVRLDLVRKQKKRPLPVQAKALSLVRKENLGMDLMGNMVAGNFRRPKGFRFPF